MSPLPSRHAATPWRPTRALGRALVVGLLAMVLGAASGRPDLCVVAAPLLGLVTWAVATRPDCAPRVSGEVTPDLAREGDTLDWRLSVETVPGLRDVVALLPTGRWLSSTPSHGQVAQAASPGTTTLGMRLHVERWGRHVAGPGEVLAFGDFAAYVWTPSPGPEPKILALPTPGTFEARGSLPHPVGLVGQHRSRRPGEGAELAEVRLFRSGDRLRRINWPVSLRTGELHVTTTYADQDAQVRLAVDALHDVGPRDRARSLLTSLDISLEAAGALAAHYLGTGDRVGLTVLGGRASGDVPAVGGAHQLQRILVALAAVTPPTGSVQDTRRLASAMSSGVSPGALVVLLSPLVATETLAHAVRLARSGHDVVVVDTMPPQLRRPDAPAEVVAAMAGTTDAGLASLAWRLRLLQREVGVERCRAAGVPVIPWLGPGTLDAVLAGVARRARAPRVARR